MSCGRRRHSRSRQHGTNVLIVLCFDIIPYCNSGTRYRWRDVVDVQMIEREDVLQMRITWAVLKGLPNLWHLIIVVLGPSVLPRGKTKVALREQKMRDSEPLMIECGPYYKSAPRHKWEGDGVVSETATINFGVTVNGTVPGVDTNGSRCDTRVEQGNERRGVQCGRKLARMAAASEDVRPISAGVRAQEDLALC